MTATVLRLPANTFRRVDRGDAAQSEISKASPLTLDPGWGASYDDRLVKAVLASEPSRRRGLSLFLDWLRQSAPGSTAYHVRTVFLEQEPSSQPNGIAYEIAFVETFREWQATILNGPGPQRPWTRYMMASRAKSLIETLSREGHRGIPVNFRAAWISTRTPRDRPSSPSLGESSWPELADFHGMSRERRALELARADYLRSFLAYERFFIFGQSVLRGETPPGTCAEARSKIRKVLELHLRAFRETGRALVRAQPSRNRELGIRNIDVWRRAGAPDVTELASGVRKFHAACLASLGPTSQMVDAAKGVLLCDTGWNVQPMEDLSKDPFLFVSETGAQIASAEFLASFKKRAGAVVLAYLERTGPFDPTWAAMAKPIWNEVVEEHGSEDGADGYGVLSESDEPEAISGIEVLRRYMAAADIIRNWDPTVAAFEGMWVALTDKGILRTFTSKSAHSYVRREGYPKAIVICRKDFTRKAIRKTVLLLAYGEASSIVAAATAGGHQTKSTILPHYLNTPPVNADLDAKVRMFQDEVEVIVMEGLDQEVVAFRLGRTPAHLHRLRLDAQESGVAILFGLADEEPEEGPGPALNFYATGENLEELYLLHRALRRMQTLHPNRARFRQVFLPLLAVCKLIGRMVFAKNLGPAYWRAARGVRKKEHNVSNLFPGLEEY